MKGLVINTILRWPLRYCYRFYKSFSNDHANVYRVNFKLVFIFLNNKKIIYIAMILIFNFNFRFSFYYLKPSALNTEQSNHAHGTITKIVKLIIGITLLNENVDYFIISFP